MFSEKSAFSAFLSKKFLSVILCFLTFFSVQANSNPGSGGHSKKFDAGKMIMHHVADAHEWHLFTVGHTHVTIPLPIIIYGKNGLEGFMSSKFKSVDPNDHEGPREYGNYVYEHGKIHTKDHSEFYDISITKNTAAMMVSVLVLSLIFISVARAYGSRPKSSPKGLQSLVEPLIIFIRDEVAKPSIGAKYQKFMPYLLTVFFFIWANNLFGLIPFFPGGANVTGNIAITMVLALFTFIITTFSAKKDYWIHIFNTPGVPWWLKLPIPLMPIVELMGVFTKPFVLMVRLFANITAGHIIILGFISLIFIFGEMNQGLGIGVSLFSVAFSLFISVLELLVAFLQAYVFTLLSALYFGSAVEEHHHEEHQVH